MTDLTERQAQLHAYLCSRWNDPPTVREIASHMGISSPNGVMCHLKALEDKGFIKTPDDKRSRGVILLRGPDLDGTDINIAGRMYRLVSMED
jgi:repressor LexA